MAWLLIESQGPNQRSVFSSGGFLSLAVHTAVIGGLLYATLSARASDTRIQFDTTLVMMAPEPAHQPAPPAPVLEVSLKGFQTVVVPEVIPTAIPQIDLHEHFDPKDFTGAGVEGGRASGLTPGANEVFSETAVDEVPMLLAAPVAEYPSLLRQAGISGRVLLQAVVDTAGRAEPGSIRVVKSPSPGFDRPSRQWILKALFRPARLRGRAVRVLVNLPLDYTLASSASTGGR